jgi:sulfur-carrier protein
VTTILYFAWVRDAVGVAEEAVDIPGDVLTVADLADWLAKHHPILADRDRLRVAVDLVMAGFDAPVAGAKEIAFFPPVTGG